MSLNPFGFQARASITETAYVSKLQEFPIVSGYSSNIFTYAPVVYATTSTTVYGLNVPTAPGSGSYISTLLGIVEAFGYYTVNGFYPFATYWAASGVLATGTMAMGKVNVDKECLFECQTFGSTLTTGANINNITQNFSISSTNFAATPGGWGQGSTATGYSTAGVDGTATTTTWPFKLVSLAPNIGNNWGVAGNQIYVKFNQSILSNAN